MPTRTINMEVEKQVGPSCTAFAASNLVKYLYRQKYGVSLKLDTLEFYDRIKHRTDLDVACKELKDKGIKTTDGKYIKIKGFSPVLRGDIWNTVKLSGPILLEIDKENGEPLHERLDENLVLQHRKNGNHSVVGLEVDSIYMCIADSNRKTPDYWWMKMVQQKMIKDAYYINL